VLLPELLPPEDLVGALRVVVGVDFLVEVDREPLLVDVPRDLVVRVFPDFVSAERSEEPRVLRIAFGCDGFSAFLFAGILDCDVLDVLEFRPVAVSGFLRVLELTMVPFSLDPAGLACAAVILALLLAEEFSRDVLIRLVPVRALPVSAPLALLLPVENPASLSSRLAALRSEVFLLRCPSPYPYA
jgi:hypothetical protein